MRRKIWAVPKGFFHFWQMATLAEAPKLGHAGSAGQGSPWLTLEQWQLRTTHRHGNC